ncbi:MAG: hypothetical protein ACJA01_003824 [Saprospiraceae bacterium]|jgi:hypothetical protein
MTLIEKKRQIERLDSLIRRKATGSPKVLASKFNTSERNIYRLIDEMKSLGCPVAYCRTAQSYKYVSNIDMRISLEVRDQDQLAIQGGKGFSYYFSSLPDSGSEESHISGIDGH